MVKRIRSNFILVILVAAVLAFFTNVYASDIVVKAKTDKAIYTAGEFIEITLEVENHSDYQIVPDPTPTVRDPSRADKGGNLTFEKYKNEWGPYNSISHELLSYGYLMPIILSDGVYRPPVIPPHSNVIVGRTMIKAVADSYPW